MESYLSNEKVTFQVLQARLISVVNARIQNGDFSERALARVLGISQPQIHNVLKGARRLRPELADRLISIFEMTIADLLETAELQEQLALRNPESNAWFGLRHIGAASHLEPKHWRSSPRGKSASAETHLVRPDKEQAS